MCLFGIGVNGYNLAMDYLLITSALISSFSFLVYAVSYFTSPHMKSEFKRFELEKLGLFTIVLQFLGALGLLVGLYFRPILLLASAGLAILMFFGLIVRIKTKDSLWVSLPAIFYMGLNACIFYWGMND
jgi:hypothetical protein